MAREYRQRFGRGYPRLDRSLGTRMCRIAAQAAGAEPRAAIVRDERPDPLKEHAQTIAKPDQEQQVQEEPGQPSQRARKLELAEVGDGSRAPNRRQRALVVIAKWYERLARERAQDVSCGVARLLHCRWRHARH